MSQPSFFIFGVPDGFDILGGDLVTTNYFQNYYNPSKENTKFSIHRNAGGGGITYAYLKYNLSSGKGREGSFFGMALYFPENGCCTDILKLYRLFDTIYDKVILADGEILKSTDGTSYIQAKYAVTRFNEKREYITQRIQSNILSNLDAFADSFVPIDGSFTSENPDLGKRVPLQNADNDKLWSLLRQYNRLSISPDWVGTGDSKQPTMPEEVLWQWNNNSTELSLYVNQCYRNLESANVAEVKRQSNLIKKINETFKKCLCSNDAVQEVINCYNKTKQIYSTLEKDYDNLLTKLGKAEDSGGGPLPPPPPPPIPWWILSCVLAVVAIIFVILICKPSETIKPEEEQQTRIEKDVCDLINRQEYMKACEKADSLNDVNRRKHLQDSALCLNVDQVINSTSHEYSEAYIKITSKINNSETQNKKNAELVYAWESYIDKIIKDIEKDKDKKKAGEWKTNINSENSIGKISNKRLEFNQRLEKVINSSVQSPNEKPQVQSYEIWFYRTNRNFTKVDEEQIIIKKDETINLKGDGGKGTYLVYCIRKIDGSKSTPIDDSSCISIENKNLKRVKIDNWGKGWYGVSAGGTITIKKGDLNCKITIVNN